MKMTLTCKVLQCFTVDQFALHENLLYSVTKFEFPAEYLDISDELLKSAVGIQMSAVLDH